MSISEYIAIFRHEIEKLDTFGFAESIDFRDELRAGKQAIIKVDVSLVDGSTLVIREYVDAKYEIEILSYAYHFQDKNNILIFRYDNASHKPMLNFEQHKHIGQKDIIEASPPNIIELLEEVISYL